MNLSTIIKRHELFFTITMALLVSALFFFLRSNYISDLVGGFVSDKVNASTGLYVGAGRFYINPFPLFVGARDITLTDNDGDMVASVGKIKAYIAFSSIFSGKLSSHRVVLDRPLIDYSSEKPFNVSPHMENSQKGKSYSWDGVLIIRNGAFSYESLSGSRPLRAEGVDAEISFSHALSALFSIESFRYDIPGRKWPEIAPSIKGRFKYIDSKLEIDALSAFMDDSVFRVGGEIIHPGTAEMDGTLDIRLDLNVKSLNESFGLSKSTKGKLGSEGTLRLGKSLEKTWLDISLGGDFNLETLLEALRTNKEIQDSFTGKIKFEGFLRGYLTNLKGKASAVIRDSVIYGISIDSATAEVAYSDGLLDISEGNASLYNGDADVNVSFNVLRHEPFSLSVAFRDTDSGPLFDRIHIGNIGLPSGKVGGELHSDGKKFSPRGWVHFKGGSRDDTPLGRMNYLSGRFHTRDRALILDGFDLRSKDTQVLFDGLIGLEGEEVGFNGHAITSNISDVLAPYDFGLRAGGSVDVSVSGTKEDPYVSFKASLWNSFFRDYLLGEIELSADYKKDLLVIKELNANTPEAHHTARGKISFPMAKHLFDLAHPSFDLHVNADNADLGGLIAIFANDIKVSGLIDTGISLNGTLNALDLKGHASVKNSVAYSRRIESGSIDYYLRGDNFGVINSLFTRGQSKVYLSGKVASNGNYDLKARTEDAWLSYLVPEVEKANFKLDMSASGHGRVNDPSFTLDAKLSSGNFMNVPVGDGHISASMKQGKVNASLVLMDGNLSARGKAGTKGKRPWELDLSLKYDRYDHILRSLSPLMPKEVIVAMDGDIKLKGDKEHLSANIRLERANTTIYGQGFASIGPFELDVSDNLIEFRNISMRGAHASFEILGSMDIGRRIDLVLVADASLLPFTRYSSAVSYLKGDTRTSLNIKGPWRSPDITGRTKISDASVGFRRIPQRITAINAVVVIDKGKAVIESGSAKAGGGNLKISGNFDMDGFNVKDINIEASMRDMSARLASHFNAEFDGYLLLTGDKDSQHLNGEVLINKASYRERQEWGRLLLRDRSESPLSEAAWKENVKLNVRLYGDENLRVDNNLAIAPIKADLFVRGTLSSPAFLGRIEAVGGKVFFRNSELNIIGATADYSDLDPGKPVIGITAQADINGYEVWLNMHGRADKMDLELSSDPPLDDNEILTLLTYGGLGGGFGTLESGLGTLEATYLLTGELQDLMEERLTIFTGLDRFQIDPYLSRTTGSVTPRLTVSKKLMDDKLYLTYASTLDAASENEVKLEYLFGENVSVIGGQDYTGSVGGDLKFRFRFE